MGNTGRKGDINEEKEQGNGREERRGKGFKTKDYEKAVKNTAALKGFIFFFNLKD